MKIDDDLLGAAADQNAGRANRLLAAILTELRQLTQIVKETLDGLQRKKFDNHDSRTNLMASQSQTLGGVSDPESYDAKRIGLVPPRQRPGKNR